MFLTNVRPAECPKDNESSDKTVVFDSAVRDGDEDNAVVVLDSVAVREDSEDSATRSGIKSSGSHVPEK